MSQKRKKTEWWLWGIFSFACMLILVCIPLMKNSGIVLTLVTLMSGTLMLSPKYKSFSDSFHKTVFFGGWIVILVVGFYFLVIKINKK